MELFSYSICILVLCWANTNSVQAWGKDYERVRLSDVQVITLYSGRMTEGRRSSPVPQLKCVGGSCSAFTPQAVQCKNVGSDGYDAQWECKCEFPSDVKFGRISVSCEGYDYPNDPFILKGSCGLEYTIEKTGSDTYYGSGNLKHSYDSSGGIGSGMLFIIILIGIGVFMCCLTSQDPRDPNHRGNYHPHDGGSPPPPGGNPPPYGWKQPGEDARYRGGYNSPPPSAPPPPTYEESTGQPGTSSGRQRGNNDGPGFWTGMGLGAVAGSLFSRPRTHHRRSGWFGSSGSSTTHHHHYHQPGTSSSSWGSSSSSSSWGASSSSGSSSSRPTTSRTSYGGTTRR